MVNVTASAEYLCVDEFMRDVVGAGAVQSAFELGLIDGMLRDNGADLLSATRYTGLDPRALQLLLEMLQAYKIVEDRNGRFELAARFRMALQYRDLLQAKLEFAALVAPDFLELFSTLLRQPADFFQRARIFDLFSYDRCLESTPENLALTRRWVHFTTALTRYEARACIERHDFSACRRLLDVGGNSGEFALRICEAYPDVHATVLDLPVVCDIGTEYVMESQDACRIEFVRTRSAGQKFPNGFDTVCFKSMLHDWPDPEMHRFLERAFDSMVAGGQLLIFERGTFEVGGCQIPYSQIPIMLFFRSYRSPQDYIGHLQQIGFHGIRLETIELDVSFMLITALK